MLVCVVFGIWYFDFWLLFFFLRFAILDKYMGHLVCSYFVLKAWFGWIIGDFADVMPCLLTVLGLDRGPLSEILDK